jgi:hypothetical protein
MLFGLLVIATSCSYDAAMQRLPPPEQAEFRAYRNVMSASQAWTYLGKASPAERQAYAREIGVAQRLQALDPQDREAVLLGYPRQGMSAEALMFLWGDPAYKRGDARHYAQWHYSGSPMSLTVRGSDPYVRGNRVMVELVDGHVTSWVDYVPTDDEKGGNDGDRKSM